MSDSTSASGPIVMYPAGTQSHFWMIEKLEFHPCLPEKKKVPKKSSWVDKQIRRRGWT